MVNDLGAAYEACATFAREHYENFPVASWLLPRGMRPHVSAVYAFARVADDFADEGDRPEAERLALLDTWRRLLYECAADPGRTTSASGSAPPLGLPPATPHIFAALGSTIRTCGLAVAPFDDLLSAFRQDVTTRRYESWEALLDYCRRSANPVGRLVLGIAGCRDAELERSADALCTALQLTNFWQDVERDWRKGRLYLPLDECRRAGASLADLDSRATSEGWRTVLHDAGGRTAELFEQGRRVCDGVDGRLRWELRLTWLGGRRILSRLQRGGFDIFGGRPALGAGDVPALLWQAMTWRAR